MAKFEKKRIYRAIVKICISQTKSIWFICYDVCDSLKIFLLCSDIFIIDLQHNFGGQTKIPHCFFGRALSILSLRKLTSLADKELFRKKLIYAMEKQLDNIFIYIYCSQRISHAVLTFRFLISPMTVFSSFVPFFCCLSSTSFTSLMVGCKITMILPSQIILAVIPQRGNFLGHFSVFMKKTLFCSERQWGGISLKPLRGIGFGLQITI